MSELLPTVEIEPAVPATATVIWLHGLGADGHDFEPVVPELGLPPGHAIRFVFPHAPRRPVTVNGGFVMRAWYDILGFDGPVSEDAAGIRASAAQITALIARENARGIPDARIVLAGFSQGAAMALHTGLRHRERLAGLLALSGYLPLAATLAAERSPANAATPVFLAHGEIDAVVRFPRGTATRDWLVQLGWQPEWHDYPIGHEVCWEELRDIGAFLNRVLPARP